jgi:hypothetical protein
VVPATASVVAATFDFAVDNVRVNARHVWRVASAFQIPQDRVRKGLDEKQAEETCQP